MASIYREIDIAVDPERVWDVIRDVAVVHTRLAPGFVADVRMEGDVRIVTFATGRVLPERIVGIDDANRRMAYTAVGVPERKHHNASFQVLPQGNDESRLVWITDVLPDTLADTFAENMEKGLAVAKHTLEQQTSGAR
ncbi:MAG TPA: SRPBCC family protein [Acetobacteraceae bacterium]|nr:SRPBCC family protein [Acetobacteraceae bacterium]